VATVRILRSTTAGNTPASLVSGQIAINEGDGKLFYRNSSGVVTALATGGSSLLSYATPAQFPATGASGSLYLAEDTSRLYQWETTVYVEVGVSGGGIALADGSVTTEKIADGAATDAKIASVAASKLTGTIADDRLSSAVATYAAIAASANQPSSVVDAFVRGEAGVNTIGITSGTMKMTFFTPLVTTSITQITFASGNAAASGLTLARFGLYTFDETTATLVARTASDTTLFAAINTAYTRSLDSTGGYPTSYTLTAGVRYGVALLVVGTTTPTIPGRQINISVAPLTPRMSGDSSGRTDLPTTTTVTAALGQLFARLS
jgi:hypothetical protein